MPGAPLNEASLRRPAPRPLPPGSDVPPPLVARGAGIDDWPALARASQSQRSFVAEGLPALAAAGPPLTGLKLWLRGDAGVTLSGSNVATWADQSGSGNDVSQGTGVNQPAFASSAINGLPGVTFAANTVLTRSTSPLTAGSARTVIVVAKPAANSSGGNFQSGGTFITFKHSNVDQWVGQLGQLSAGLGAGTRGWSNTAAGDTITSPPTVLNTASEFEISSTVASLPSFVINGSSYGTTGSQAVTTDNGADGLFIGNYDILQGTMFFAGTICELLVYDHVLNASELAATRSYLQRYGIVLLPSPGVDNTQPGARPTSRPVIANGDALAALASAPALGPLAGAPRATRRPQFAPPSASGETMAPLVARGAGIDSSPPLSRSPRPAPDLTATPVPSLSAKLAAVAETVFTAAARVFRFVLSPWATTPPAVPPQTVVVAQSPSPPTMAIGTTFTTVVSSGPAGPTGAH